MTIDGHPLHQAASHRTEELSDDVPPASPHIESVLNHSPNEPQTKRALRRQSPVDPVALPWQSLCQS
jgi:hypothetical protein